MTTWSICINNSTADLENPPEGLIKGLMPSRAGTNNPLRPPTGSQASRSVISNSSNQLPPATPVANFPRFDPYTGLPINQITSTATPTNEIASVTPLSTVDLTIFSDSIEGEADPAERLENYMDWLVSKVPRLAGMLADAKELLLDNGHTFKTIETMPYGEFKRMGINYGIAQQIKDCRAFYKARVLGQH